MKKTFNQQIIISPNFIKNHIPLHGMEMHTESSSTIWSISCQKQRFVYIHKWYWIQMALFVKIISDTSNRASFVSHVFKRGPIL